MSQAPPGPSHHRTLLKEAFQPHLPSHKPKARWPRAAAASPQVASLPGLVLWGAHRKPNSDLAHWPFPQLSQYLPSPGPCFAISVCLAHLAHSPTAHLEIPYILNTELKFQFLRGASLLASDRVFTHGNDHMRPVTSLPPLPAGSQGSQRHAGVCVTPTPSMALNTASIQRMCKMLWLSEYSG